MAINATIFKVELQIADMDRSYYQTHNLTIALHPSETEERMMFRILAFALNAHEDLTFGKGISSDNEPDLWQRNLHADVELWIDLGQPDEKRVRKACAKADKSIIYIYQPSVGEVWFKQNRKGLKRFDNLQVFTLNASEQLENMAQRTMQLNCTIQDGEVWLSDGEHNIQVVLEEKQIR